jgi:hypothetical protein
MPRRFPWSAYSDERLLHVRLKDLKVTVEGTWLEGCMLELYDELEQRGLRIKPHAWISDEWFAPDTTPGIAIPFYLAHPRLARLEKKKMLEVEGGTEYECMRILRHEAGHAIQHAYALHRRRKWQKLFGRSSQRYPKYYRPNPASKNFVQHLPLWYGQSHPDEDFAETFAVWMRPHSAWRKRYAGWGALKKLEYVDELIAEIATEKPKLTRKLKVDPLSTLKHTIGEYYEKKQALYAVVHAKTYDKDLRRIFSSNPKYSRSPLASQFLRRNRVRIRQMVAKWTGEHQLTLDSVIDYMIGRCRELKLRAVGPERQLVIGFTILLTATAVHSLYSPSRREWFAL